MLNTESTYYLLRSSGGKNKDFTYCPRITDSHNRDLTNACLEALKIKVVTFFGCPVTGTGI